MSSGVEGIQRLTLGQRSIAESTAQAGRSRRDQLVEDTKKKAEAEDAARKRAVDETLKAIDDRKNGGLMGTAIGLAISYCNPATATIGAFFGNCLIGRQLGEDNRHEAKMLEAKAAGIGEERAALNVEAADVSARARDDQAHADAAARTRRELGDALEIEGGE